MTYFAEKVLPLSKTVHELISSQLQFSYELEEITTVHFTPALNYRYKGGRGGE